MSQSKTCSRELTIMYFKTFKRHCFWTTNISQKEYCDKHDFKELPAYQKMLFKSKGHFKAYSNL